MSNKVKAFNIFLRLLKYFPILLILIDFVLLALVYMDPFNANSYSLGIYIVLGVIIVFSIFRIIFGKLMLKKAKARLQKNIDFINTCEYENRLSDSKEYLENELKKEYVMEIYLNNLINYSNILLILDEREQARNIAFTTDWKMYDQAASLLKFIFYAYDENFEKLNIEHNKIKAASIGNDLKSVARYVYSVINKEEPCEKPSKIMYPIVDEIISRYQTTDSQ